MKLNKFLEKYIILIVVLVILWCVFAPILLTHFSIIDFTESGQIGDTIGGITAPAIGLLSIILLYITLIKQVEKNNSESEEMNFRILYEEMEKLESSIETYQFMNEHSERAIGRFTISFERIVTVNQWNEVLNDSDLESFYNKVIRRFLRMQFLIRNLKTSARYKEIIERNLIECFNKARMPEAYISIVNTPGLRLQNNNYFVVVIRRDFEGIFNEILEIQSTLK